MSDRTIISRAPYRVSFFGGGTDYQSWYEKNGGLILSTAIDRYCHVAFRKLPPFFRHRSRIVYSKVEEVARNEDISHPVVRNCLAFHNISEGVEVHHNGELPGRSGVGSSSAFSVAMLQAIAGFKGKTYSKRNLALDAIWVEQRLCRENVGIQDQISSAFGGLNEIRIGKNGSFEVCPVVLSKEYQARLESHLVLGFTGVQRNGSPIAGATIKAIETGAARRSLSEIMQIANEGITVLKREKSLRDFGELLHRSWMWKRELCSQISNPDIDRLYSKAREIGAWGGKLSGAGAGGFVLLMAPPEIQAQLKEHLCEIKAWVPVKMTGNSAEIVIKDAGLLPQTSPFSEASEFQPLAPTLSRQ